MTNAKTGKRASVTKGTVLCAAITIGYSHHLVLHESLL